MEHKFSLLGLGLVCSKESQNVYAQMQQNLLKYTIEAGKYVSKHPLKGKIYPITCHEGTEGE
jgi:hypothetical protein